MSAMKLSDLTKEQLATLAKQVGCNAEHLYKISKGYRPCTPQLAEKIEAAFNGLLRKEDLVWPK